MSTPEKIKKFYQSAKWKKARAYIRAKNHGICEECGNVGHEVHHIISLNLNNIDDVNVTIDEKNLQLLCTSCHNAKRSDSVIRKDVEFTPQGDLIKKKPHNYMQYK